MLKPRYFLLGGAVALGAFAIYRARRAISHIGPITGTVTINKPPREVYELMRDFSRLPEFMSYLDKVEEDGERSTWTADLPIVGKQTWHAQIVDDVVGSLLSWTSDRGLSGRVTFSKAPGRESTEVRVEMQIKGSKALARVFAAPEVKANLRRLKQVLETGEVLVSDASAHVAPHAAVPAADAKPAPDFFIPHVPNAEKGAAS